MVDLRIDIRTEGMLNITPCKRCCWPFKGGTSFVDLLCFFCLVFVLSLCVSVYLCLVVTCLERADLGSRLWCITVSLSLSRWYPGSGMVLDCIGSWSLHPNLQFVCSIVKFISL